MSPVMNTDAGARFRCPSGASSAPRARLRRQTGRRLVAQNISLGALLLCALGVAPLTGVVTCRRSIGISIAFTFAIRRRRPLDFLAVSLRSPLSMLHAQPANRTRP